MKTDVPNRTLADNALLLIRLSYSLIDGEQSQNSTRVDTERFIRVRLKN